MDPNNYKSRCSVSIQVSFHTCSVYDFINKTNNYTYTCEYRIQYDFWQKQYVRHSFPFPTVLKKNFQASLRSLKNNQERERKTVHWAVRKHTCISNYTWKTFKEQHYFLGVGTNVNMSIALLLFINFTGNTVWTMFFNILFYEVHGLIKRK